MPSRDYGYIPRTSYDAHKALAGRESVLVGSRTRLSLFRGMYGIEDTILADYRGDGILRYWPDGTVEIIMVPPYTPGVLNRVRVALPVGWAVRRGRTARRPPVLTYRSAYEVTYENPFGFLPGGGFRLNGFGVYTQEEIDRIADQSAANATLPYDDAAHRRARARTTRVREQERVRRMSTPIVWPRPSAPQRPLLPPSPDSMTNVYEPMSEADPSMDDMCTCGSTWGGHYGIACPGGTRYWEPAPCECRGRIIGEGSVHGPYACFAAMTPEDRDAAWQRAQEWLRTPLVQYRASVRAPLTTAAARDLYDEYGLPRRPFDTDGSV